MKVLVTGGTGFVGSLTAKALLEAGHQVRLLVRTPDKAKKVMHDLGVSIDDIVKGDVTDKASVESAIKGCDAVIHSAAMVSTAKKDVAKVRETNIGGTKIVMQASMAAGIKKIIYVSSISAMFNPLENRIDENSAVSTAETTYGQTKVVCEEFVREMQEQGAPVVITYPAGVVGDNDPGFSEPHFGLRMFISQFTFTSTTGMQFVNVKDVARAHVAILENMKGPDRYILGGCYYTWDELLDICRKLTGRRMVSIYIPGAVLRFIGHVGDVFSGLTGIGLPITAEGMSYATQWVYADSSKMEKELGISFTSREETLAEVIRWLYSKGYITAKKAGKLAS